MADALPDGTYVVVLSVEDEASLLDLWSRTETAGFRARLVREDDPPYCGHAMAIGFAPGPREPLQRFLSSVKLLR